MTELFDEAADYVEVVRRLWDSWEDDAEIRDVATGRFVDRDKLHYIDFEGRHFSVKGPSITPRPPQGQPLVSALAHDDRPVPAGRPVGRRRLRHPARQRPGPRRSSPRSAPSRRAAGRADEPAARLRGPGRLPRRRRRPRPRPAGTASTRSRVTPYTSDARDLHRHPAATRRPAPGVGGRPGLSGFRLRPAVLGHDLPGDHPGPGARTPAPRRLPPRLRGRHPARPAGPGPPRQPLRRPPAAVTRTSRKDEP